MFAKPKKSAFSFASEGVKWCVHDELMVAFKVWGILTLLSSRAKAYGNVECQSDAKLQNSSSLIGDCKASRLPLS